MSGPQSQVECHPKRREIEVLLAAKASLHVIAERYGVSRFAAGRHRTKMKHHNPSTWRALRREVRAAGLRRRDFTLAAATANLKGLTS